MALDVGPLITRVRTLVLATGRFSSCEGHEPPSEPGKGIRGAMWVEDIDTIESGLDVVSARVLLIVRVSRDAAGSTPEALDRIDPEITLAAQAVMNALAVDYDLGGTCRNVDFHGEEGEKVRAEGGWFEHGDKKYRAMLVRVPILVDDVWTIGGA